MYTKKNPAQHVDDDDNKKNEFEMNNKIRKNIFFGRRSSFSTTARLVLVFVC